MQPQTLTPEQQAAAALAHFFIGLIKADGYISTAEERKVEILVNKFRHGLPCAAENVMADFRAILADTQYADWLPKGHLDNGFLTFDLFVSSGNAVEDHLRTIIEMLEILSEVDGVTDTEVLYIEMIKDTFLERYGNIRS